MIKQHTGFRKPLWSQLWDSPLYLWETLVAQCTGHGGLWQFGMQEMKNHSLVRMGRPAQPLTEFFIIATGWLDSLSNTVPFDCAKLPHWKYSQFTNTYTPDIMMPETIIVWVLTDNHGYTLQAVLTVFYCLLHSSISFYCHSCILKQYWP